jgi:hypothetical protein
LNRGRIRKSKIGQLTHERARYQFVALIDITKSIGFAIDTQTPARALVRRGLNMNASLDDELSLVSTIRIARSVSIV